ncbi:MAG: GntR family transcriptional regulator [Sphingomonadales bacterium]|nr:MAG: GntR family transcriptional regulator [Sphingomonadales bacterium]
MAVTQSTSRKPSDTVSARDIGEWLRDRIRRGRFVPGQRLIEADIIRETGASRSRVREAIQRLESEGLLVIEEFRGASVKRFSIEELRQIYRARMALEGMAAHDFALLGGQDEKLALAAIQEQLNSCEHTTNHERFAALNDEWHRLIIDGARNEYIATFLQRLRVPLYRLLFATFYNSERLDLANAGHRKITIAIVNGDAPEAERLMRAHIEEGLGALASIDTEFHS